MDDEQQAGVGGGVTKGYAVAAEFGRWTLDVVGPSLYVLRAEVRRSVPAWLALNGLRVWIARGALVWAWTCDDVSVVEGRFEAVVGQPALAPRPP